MPQAQPKPTSDPPSALVIFANLVPGRALSTPQKQRSRLRKVFAWSVFLAAVAFVLLAPEIFPGNRYLYDAIDNGDEVKVRELLKAGADPNSRSRGFLNPERTTRYRFTPLHYALWRNQPKIAVQLIEAGADTTTPNPRGETVMTVASNSAYADVVRALIARGAEPSALGTTIDKKTHLKDGSVEIYRER